MKLTVTVPIPPSTNHAYATVRGRRVLSKGGREYKEQVAMLVMLAARSSRWRTRPGQRYGLSLVLHFNTKRRRDLSNCVKLLEDAATDALYFNDSAIDELVVRRGDMDADNPRCEVEVRVLTD